MISDRTLNRRRLIMGGVSASLTAGLFSGLAAPAISGTASVTSQGASRVVLGDGHILMALALIIDDPVSHLVGWQGDVVLRSASLFEAWVAQAPELAQVPVLGQASADSFSTEATVGTAPDLVILGGGYGPGRNAGTLIDRVTDFGAEVLFVDFYEDPLTNTAPSLRALGRAFGGVAQERAEAFATFYETRVAAIQSTLAQDTQARPTVLLEAHAGMRGWPCCWIPGGSGLGAFIAAAGGQHAGEAMAPGRSWVQLQLEAALTQTPDIYITTGGPYLSDASGLAIGPGVSEEEARTSLAKAVLESDLRIGETLPPENIHGLWHLFHATPLNILALEALAGWIRPDLFDPAASVRLQQQINQDHLALSVEGTLAI